MSYSYILGAGASKEYSRSKSGVQPPLAGEFFSTYSQLAISEDREVRIGDIVNYVRDTRNVKAEDFCFWNENIENFLTEIEESIERRYKSHIHRGLRDLEFVNLQKVYDRMIFLFSAVLNEIQNGEVCKNYSLLVNRAEFGDTFITLNWDTLLDRALIDTDNWFIEDGYQIPFKAVYRDKWQKIEPHTEINKSKYSLLKLHGSTNWLIPYYSFRLDLGKWDFYNEQANRLRRPIYAFHYAVNRYKTYGNRSRTGYEPLSYFYYPPDVPLGPKPRRSGYTRISAVLYPDVNNYGFNPPNGCDEVSMPLIIPPIKKKKYEFLEGALNDLWAKARQAMLLSEKIYIIGYSFPETDIKSWELLESVLLRRRKNLPPLVLVDPHPEALYNRLVTRLPFIVDLLDVHKTTFSNFLGKK